MNKVTSILNLFRVGSAVSDPHLWVAGQITGNMVGALILAIVYVSEAYKHPLPISEEAAYTIGGCIVTLFNIVVPIITHQRAGILPPKPATDQDAQSGADKDSDIIN